MGVWLPDSGRLALPRRVRRLPIFVGFCGEILATPTNTRADLWWKGGAQVRGCGLQPTSFSLRLQFNIITRGGDIRQLGSSRWHYLKRPSLRCYNQACREPHIVAQPKNERNGVDRRSRYQRRSGARLTEALNGYSGLMPCHRSVYRKFSRETKAVYSRGAVSFSRTVVESTEGQRICHPKGRYFLSCS